MIETVPSGTVLYGRYRIERVLGSGGFGHVYLAIDLTTNQQYAIKEYLVSGTSGQEQLKHEATVLSHLHHPSLPAFLDAFIERGRYYVVINYIEGSDLTDLIRITRQRNESIPVVQVLSWTLAICDAVMFLHSQHPSIIHRDIKPDNIRITSTGTAVLVDLGNAKAAADGARTLFFIRHQGTPGYAPPEQYPGGSGTDARSDVYALGGTLYFALTTQEPPSVSVRNQSLQQGLPDLPSLQDHLANNPPEETPEALEARQFRLGVTKPSKPAPRHLNHIAQLGAMPPEVLQQISAIIQKAMAIKPKNRYQLVADLANDLKKAIAVFPAPPPNTPTASHRADPHSTQPDLAGLYDAIQEAKKNAAPGAPDPGTQPMGPNNSYPCPRCSTLVLQQASFCPRCGTALSNPANIQASKPTHTYSQDISAEQTLVISSAQNGQVPFTNKVNTIASTSAASTSMPGGNHGNSQAGYGVANLTNMPAAQQRQRQQGTANVAPAMSPAQSTTIAGFQIGPRAVLAMVIVVAILITIAIFLIISQYGHGAASMPAHRTSILAFV